MLCKFCGNELPEDTNFCTECGGITDLEEDVFDSTQEEEKKELGGSILKFSIMGLAFGVTVILSVLGIIFSAIAKGKLKHYQEKFGETEGRATVGKHLSVSAQIVSIVCFLIGLLSFVSGLISSLSA